MVMTETKYDTNLLKGTGLIEETLILLEAYEKGLSKKKFYDKVFELDLLSKSTENRAKDIVKKVFFRRFWEDEMEIPHFLKMLRRNFISIDILRQIILIYTCRANPILGDFIKEVYFNFIKKSFQKLESSDPKDFIKEAIKDGSIEKPWSDSTIKKVSEHMIACLIDFGFIDRSKNILQVQLFDTTANYLAHELHFRGLTDDQILHHPDWRLFDLDYLGVAEKLQRISWQGHFLFQYSGELLRISWKYKTMEEFIDGLTHK
jgi:hypothetical protein